MKLMNSTTWGSCILCSPPPSIGPQRDAPQQEVVCSELYWLKVWMPSPVDIFKIDCTKPCASQSSFMVLRSGPFHGQPLGYNGDQACPDSKHVFAFTSLLVPRMAKSWAGGLGTRQRNYAAVKEYCSCVSVLPYQGCRSRSSGRRTNIRPTKPHKNDLWWVVQLLLYKYSYDRRDLG